MTIVTTNTATLSPEKATEIMSAMITAGTFNPETYKAACEAYLAVITPPAAPEAVKKERKQRAPNKPGSQQGWAANVTREEYTKWKDSLAADYAGPINSYEYRRLRDEVQTPAVIDIDSENSNDAVNPPAAPSPDEIHGQLETEDNLASIVEAEEEKHAALAGNVKPGVSKKNKSK